ncbi:hypothetical protein [Caldifermentibacillus hisashii]|uniref:hypothetical protein n=1 Tax=Caldifermentibacillus hisashii TaxID=996558 RepID=UPI001C108430|nr:hypothetical protein [Caldifermentibacillus hisashii]MBU5341973.1 hypothetical protein [Caldifermentibacillus hisashii]
MSVSARLVQLTSSGDEEPPLLEVSLYYLLKLDDYAKNILILVVCCQQVWDKLRKERNDKS